MGPCPTCVLVLVVCLVQSIHMLWGALRKPSIRAEPGPVIYRGQPVTIVCWGPAQAELFRLQDKNRSKFEDQKSVSQHGSDWTEARFHIKTENEFTSVSYFCQYHDRFSWSEPSELLELKVTAPPGLSPEQLYILVGICVASLLCLLLLALLLVCRQHQKKSGPPSSKGEEPRPQERLSPTADLTESPADVVTSVDALPEENGDMHSPSPAAGDPQEVTYAQLDQWVLTRRAARTESPQPTEPTAESSMYAALPRH